MWLGYYLPLQGSRFCLGTQRARYYGVMFHTFTFMASSSQTSLNMAVLLQHHSRPVLLSGAKMCESVGDHPSKPQIFYTIHHCFSCLFRRNNIKADRRLLLGPGAVFYCVAPDRHRNHSKRGPIESDLMYGLSRNSMATKEESGSQYSRSSRKPRSSTPSHVYNQPPPPHQCSITHWRESETISPGSLPISTPTPLLLSSPSSPSPCPTLTITR